MRVEPDADQETHLTDQDERQPVLHHRQPPVALGDGRLALIEASIQRLCPANLFGVGLDPYRFIANHLIAFENRCDIGVDPVMVAVLAAVLDNAHPWLALFQRIPQVRKHRRRDIRVPHQIVRRTDQLFAGEPTDFDEGVVAVADHTFGVGRGNQPLLSGKGALALGDGLVVTHGFSIRKALITYRPGGRDIEYIFQLSAPVHFLIPAYSSLKRVTAVREVGTYRGLPRSSVVP